MYKVLTENLLLMAKEVKRPMDKRELPVLNYGLLSSMNGYITLTTTDLKEFYTAKAGCKIDGDPFSVCVPVVNNYTVTVEKVESIQEYKRTSYPLYDLLKVIDYPVISLDLDPVRMLLVLSYGNSKTVFKCLDAEEFPNIPQEK